MLYSISEGICIIDYDFTDGIIVIKCTIVSHYFAFKITKSRKDIAKSI